MSKRRKYIKYVAVNDFKVFYINVCRELGI